MEKVGRNEPCPCGSGKKHKRCCWGARYQFLKGEDGQVVKQVPLSPEAIDVLKKHKERMAAAGRPTGPGDLVFPDMPPEKEVISRIVAVMKKAGLPPDKVYATEKTGMIVTEDNYDLLTPAERQEWEDAIDEYWEKKPYTA